MHPALIPAARSKEFATRERCHITELLNDPAVPDVSLARCRVEPGVTTELHSLQVTECYVVTAGIGLMEVAGAPAFPVAAGDAVEIPAGQSQRIRNTGDESLVFSCLCRPRFTAATYIPLDDSLPFNVGD